MATNIDLLAFGDGPLTSAAVRAASGAPEVWRRQEWQSQSDGSTNVLDPTRQSPEAERFEKELRGRIIGQDGAILQLTRIYQAYLAGLAAPGRPLANLLLLGPTGSGKTRLVEAAAEVLFGTPYAVFKIDCAEFQHSHEISKLLGSPPGYVGHRETHPLLTQEVLEQHYTEKAKVSLVLFDEIEKASDALWQLLLGILDKARLTLGGNRRVDFSRSLIFLTSNLGSHEMTKVMSGGLGFTAKPREGDAGVDQMLYRAAMDEARRKFSPEFMNRIDKVLVFRNLKREHLEKILDIELEQVRQRIALSGVTRQFVFRYTASARDFLLQEGTDYNFGARHLKRSIERHLVFPLSNLLATGQVNFGDIVTIKHDPETSELSFVKEGRRALVREEAIPNLEAGWVPMSQQNQQTESYLDAYPSNA